MVSLRLSSIKNGRLHCKRNDTKNIAIIKLCPEALHIIEKSKTKCIDDYLLSIFTHKHITAVQQIDRIKRISELSNQGLKKVSKILKLKNIITMKISKRAFVEHSLSNRISLEMIAQSLGCSIETVFKYNSHQPILKKQNTGTTQ